jgi:hypothetical protein
MSTIHNVDFKNITPRNGSQSNAFEEFCCQIARHTPKLPEGTEFIRYRGAGGDGGVECVLRLPNGDEWGWQVKFMFDLSKAKASLDDSIETAIKLHPKLKCYTICLPFDLTGPTARKKGKSQREYFDTYITEWEKLALAEGVDLKVSLSTPSSLLDDLLAFDPEGGRLRFWFDANILGDDWFAQHLREVKASAGVRYTPQLRIETPIGEALEALGLTDEWFESLKGRINEFTDLLKQWNDALERTSNTILGDAFPESIRQEGAQASDILHHLAAEYSRIAQLKDITVDMPTLGAQANEAISLFRELRVTLARDLDSRYGEGSAESQGFRQFQAEYQCSFPAANLDIADDAIRFLELFSKWVDSPVAHLLGATELLIAGAAGVGKTHAICDIAERRHEFGLRTIVLYGERFTASVEPWVQLRQQLGFGATLSRNAMLDMLDAAGEASGKPLLLCIDGLNETKPRPYWPNHLTSFITQLRPQESIRLCVSCRTTYESQVIPKGLSITTIIHQGFAGFEFDACKEFFAYYGLEPPVAPILQPEFSNPLFLRLICEAMDSAGQTQLPLGWLGINSAINAFIQAKNERYATEHDSHPSNRYPERALKALVSSYEQEQTSALPWSKAKQVTETVLTGSQLNASLLDWLIREGMLLVDADPDPLDSTPEDYVRIAFERLGDNLLAAKFLDSLDAQSIHKAFEAKGSLLFVVADQNAVDKHRGLLEALSIQIPERLGLELPDVVPRVELTDDVIRLTVEALPWRDPNYLTRRTGQLLSQSLGLRRFAHPAFDVALSISTRQSNVDAFWLNDLLRTKTMPDRDAFWCGYLYQSYEDQGPVEKLIRAAFAVDVAQIPVEVVSRWAVVLLWFCSAPDRRVRDYATKALVRISEPVPNVWDTLVDTFIGVDDDYVVERCLLGAYGALMRTRNTSVEASVAQRIYEEVFKDSSRFQNQLIRDHARSIVELAAADNVLPTGIVKSEYIPPYESEWPLTVPTAAEVEQYRFSNKDLPKLFHSCFEDDFSKYTLGVIDRFADEIGRMEGARWIFHHVLEMGYTKERFANYDGYIVYKYGGGRGRPAWAERVGKKYQWIALARLIARLSDHAKFKYDKWQPKPLITPLVYERGRDTDPSVLSRSTLSKANEPSWWIPERYDFEAVSEMRHQEWVQVHDDLPNTLSMVSERIDRNGTRWIVLQAYPEWTSKTPQISNSEPHRLVWFYLHSFLIPAGEAEACWKWLKKQNFFGAWMPEGSKFHDAFIGEFPWATTVNLYGDSYNYGDSFEEKKPPCEMYPTASLIYISHEKDAYQEGTINVLVPAKRFFKHLPMKWDGGSGYTETGGRPCFLDPSFNEPGPPALLVEAPFLEDFLSQNSLSIFWTVVGEKLRLVGDSWPRLVYSRAHILTAKGLRSSRPVISHD